MNKRPSKYINRELSWLEFNQRVLDEARDSQIPSLERLKFLAITASNLDEFFMVRVGGLQLLLQREPSRTDPTGRTVAEQLDAIGTRTRQMVTDQYACFNQEIEPKLAEAGIVRVNSPQLSKMQQKSLKRFFKDEIISVLSPIAVGDEHEFPLLGNQTLNVCFRLNVDAESPKTLSSDASSAPAQRYAVMPVAGTLPRLLNLPAEEGVCYILLEEAIAFLADEFFPGQKVLECVPFRITRNADMSVREDGAGDLLSGMEEVLDARKLSACVRLEIDQRASEQMLQFLTSAIDVSEGDVFPADGPLDLSAMMRLTRLQGFEPLKYETWTPQPSTAIDPSKSLFENISQQDILLVHPYDRFEPVVRFVEEAADDPDVLAIKQTLYRTSRNSPMVAALVRAAENGKHVTVIVELKARFDEARNIEWARHLEQAGVQVIYGVKGLKTHAKVCIVVRRETEGIQRYIHFGTGNYNEITAGIYSDISLLTRDEDLGADAISFFNAITGYSQPERFRKIEAAPIGLRDKLLEMIDSETQRKKQGHRAQISAKLNSLVDPEMIDALYAASSAGVKIRLNVRGICCLRPGVKGLSENISVVSIVDRFLEHARIFYFYHGGDERVFISSADWMTRNLDRRVELLVPVEAADCRRRLISVLDCCFQDNQKSHRLQSDGTYERIQPKKKQAEFSCQRELYRQACEAVANLKKSKLSVFEPHRGPHQAS